MLCYAPLIHFNWKRKVEFKLCHTFIAISFTSRWVSANLDPQNVNCILQSDKKSKLPWTAQYELPIYMYFDPLDI